MSAHEYYTTYPQHPISFDQTHQQQQQQQHTFPADFRATNTSYEPYRLSASSSHRPQYPFSLSSSSLSTSSPNPSNSSSSSDSSFPGTDRGFLHPTSQNGPVLKKSKSERAIKFVEKQVKKQIEKKLNGHSHGGGGHGYGQQIEEYWSQAMQHDSSGGASGAYGYGDSAQGHGYDTGSGVSGGGDGSGGGF